MTRSKYILQNLSGWKNFDTEFGFQLDTTEECKDFSNIFLLESMETVSLLVLSLLWD